MIVLYQPVNSCSDRFESGQLKSPDSQGYVQLGGTANKVRAHQVAYYVAHGFPKVDPALTDLSHFACGDKECCEPSHLIHESSSDNQSRAHCSIYSIVNGTRVTHCHHYPTCERRYKSATLTIERAVTAMISAGESRAKLLFGGVSQDACRLNYLNEVLHHAVKWDVRPALHQQIQSKLDALSAEFVSYLGSPNDP